MRTRMMTTGLIPAADIGADAYQKAPFRGRFFLCSSQHAARPILDGGGTVARNRHLLPALQPQPPAFSRAPKPCQGRMGHPMAAMHLHARRLCLRMPYLGHGQPLAKQFYPARRAFKVCRTRRQFR